MTAKFGATSTTDDVLAGLDLKDKRVLVTGTSSGLGIETARALVAHGAFCCGYGARSLLRDSTWNQPFRPLCPGKPARAVVARRFARRCVVIRRSSNERH